MRGEVESRGRHDGKTSTLYGVRKGGTPESVYHSVDGP